LSGIDYNILSSLVANPQSAQVNYRVDSEQHLSRGYQPRYCDEFEPRSGDWRVEWNDTLVLPELSGGNYLAMERYVPARGNIYDRDGNALAMQADVTAIGIVPGQILPEQEEQLFTALVNLTGLRSDDIRARYANFPPGSDWYVPLGEVPAAEVARQYETLSTLNGLQLSTYKARYYPEGGIAPHVVGYVSTIQADKEEEYLRKGYRRDERVGQWG